MRNLKLTMLAVTAVTGVVALAGCGGGATTGTEASSAPAAASSAAAASAEPVAEGAKVLWVQPMLQHPVHQLMQAGFLAQCEANGLTCDVVGNPSATSYDVPASVALADAALATTDYDVVAIYGPDPSINSYMEKIAATGTPVVTWHVLPEEGSIKGLAAATGQDIAKAGQNAAKAMGDALGGKGVIAVTQGSFNQSEDALSAAFTEALKKDFPDIKVLQPQEEGFDPSAAQAKAVSILQGNPEVTGAFSTTGAGAATWAGAKRTSGRDLTIIGVDYVRQNLDLVKDGSVFGLVAQPLYEESAMIADLASQLSKGEKVQYLNLIDAPIVTTANLDSYYALLDSAGQ